MESVGLPLCVCLSFVRLMIFSACVLVLVCSRVSVWSAWLEACLSVPCMCVFVCMGVSV